MAPLSYVIAIMLLAGSATVSAADGGGMITGSVVDQTGAVVVGADVELLDSARNNSARTTTDDTGEFKFGKLAASSYVVRVSKSGFARASRSLELKVNEQASMRFGMEIEGLSDTVTITPSRGEVQEVFETPESVTIATGEEIARRVTSVLPQALNEEAGVFLQQTTTSQGSLVIRGLTGQQVVTLINGVRFNNATLRPGANQYLAFVDPSFTGRVEVVRGSNAAQYGSDSLGGTVNVLTLPVTESNGPGRFRGGFGTTVGSADLSAGAAFRLSGGGSNWGYAGGAAGRRTQDLRTGGGIDSHSVVTRLFGLSSKVLGQRLQDTAYSQFGANGKFVYRPTVNDSVTLDYLHGTQRGVRRYDQLNGGIGNLLNFFDPQVLDFFTTRYDRTDLGFLDLFSATFSFNGQRDDRTFQNINNAQQGLRSKITDEYNRTNSFGYQAQGATHIGRRISIVFGGEFYGEYITSRRIESGFNAVTGEYSNVANVRARFPNGSRYKTLGAFGQSVVNLVPEKLTGTFGVRYSRFGYSQSANKNPLLTNGQASVPSFKTNVGDVTFNSGLVYSVNKYVNLTGSFSRGFRSPNVSDFGSVGLTGIGFEISPEEGIRLGGSVGAINPSGSQSAGDALVRPLRPETIYSFDVGIKIRSSRGSGTLAVFNSDLTDFIERRVILLPPGALGQIIGGQPIINQSPTGMVYTSLSAAPVFVRANANHVKMRGIEASVFYKLTDDVSVNANASYVRGVDGATNLPPAFENGIPPAGGFVGIKWEPIGTRYWIEAYSNFAATQDRLSDNDLQQSRIGAIRTRGEIINFFHNGAVARGLVSNGVLLATGETVEQVWLRVLGPDPNARVPLFTTNPGFATVNLRGGYRFGENSTLTLILENILDKNYRMMGSGIDGAGINLVARYSWNF